MSGERRGAGPPGERWRLILILALAGGAIGFVWGIADEPRYTATTTLIATGPKGGQPEPAELAAYAELGASERVATEAAGLLGDDVPGADLLSEVAVEPGSDGVTVAVRATSGLPDFAAATADAFAEAMVVVGDEELARRRSRNGGGPLSAGAAARIPSTPSENRAASTWALVGLGAGLLVGVLIVLATGRRPRPASALGGSATSYGVDRAALAESFGAPLLATIRESREMSAYRRIATAIGLGGDDSPRTLAVLGAADGGSADTVALGVAAAAHEIGLRVLLVEADLADPSLADTLGVEEAPGLRDYLGGTAGPRDVLRTVRTEVAGSAVALVCLPAGERTADGPTTIAGPRFEELVERLPRVYDLVVIEAPPVLADEDARLVAHLVDGVVLVAADEEAERSMIERSAAVLAPDSMLGGVLIVAEGP